MLNLGLTALIQKEQKEEVLSFEYLDSVMMYNEACDALNAAFEQFDAICVAAENLEAITAVIKEHGVTPALESLIGGNFAGGLTLEASMEAEEGAWDKIKNFIKEIWQAIKNFFLKFFTTTNGIRSRLQKFVKDAEAAGVDKVTCSEFKGVKPEFIEKLAVTPSDLSEAAGEFMAGKTAEEIEGDLALKGGDAVNYAKKLSVAIGQMENNKDKFVSICDQMAKHVDTSTVTSEDIEKEPEGQGRAVNAAAKKAKEKAAAAKKIVDLAFKGLHRSAAGFLSHVSVGKKEEAAKTEEKAETKPETKPEEKPAEEKK